MATTTRWALPYPQLDGLVAADVPQWMHDLAFALDSVAMDDQGTLASRPVSTSGSPGKRGRYYFVTGDGTPANNGILWRDNGTGWDTVGFIADGSVTSAKIADGTIVDADLAADTLTARVIAADSIAASELAAGVDPSAFGTVFPTSGLYNGYRFALLISGILFDFMYRHDLDATYGWYCVGGPGIEQDGTDVTFTTPIAGHWRGHFSGWATVSSGGDAQVHNTYAGVISWGANFAGGGSSFASGAVAAATGIRSWISGTSGLGGRIGHIIWPWKLAG